MFIHIYTLFRVGSKGRGEQQKPRKASVKMYIGRKHRGQGSARPYGVDGQNDPILK
jgi:hypothetical protein